MNAESSNFTSLEEHDINQQPTTFVQTTLNVATCCNETRYNKAGGLYRKYANEVTANIQLVDTAQTVVVDN
jgi:hypothetical protein